MLGEVAGMAAPTSGVGGGVTGRDRGADGRARNARPRDALGRPLPYGSVDVTRQPEGIRRSAQDTLDEAQRLLDAGSPFHAHEVFEDAWKMAPAPERKLWKGLAQLAVGLTHSARGNPRGAAALVTRGAAAIEECGPVGPFGVDVAALMVWSSGYTAALNASDHRTAPPLPRLQR